MVTPTHVGVCVGMPYIGVPAAQNYARRNLLPDAAVRVINFLELHEFTPALHGHSGVGPQRSILGVTVAARCPVKGQLEAPILLRTQGLQVLHDLVLHGRGAKLRRRHEQPRRLVLVLHDALVVQGGPAQPTRRQQGRRRRQTARDLERMHLEKRLRYARALVQLNDGVLHGGVVAACIQARMRMRVSPITPAAGLAPTDRRVA